jgi:hypothetical protein
MTYSDITATGRGSLSFRLVIEGLHLEAVTKSTMEKAASGSNRARKQGLSVRGVKISQRADLPRATVESESADFSFIDYDEAWTAAFAADPLHTTWLNADAIGSFSSLSVDSTTGWPDEGFLWLNSEVIRYESKTSTSFGTLTRGRYNTISQDHYTWGGARLTYPEITSSHTILQGRRVRLFAYGQGDDPQGDGQQIWLGIVSGEPRMNGPSWSLSVDPITALLEQDVGADLGPPARARGVYIPEPYEAKFAIDRLTGLTSTPAPIPYHGAPTVLGGTEYVSVSGFFESQQDFVDAVNAQIETLTSTWSSSIACVSDGNDGYHFEAYIPNVSVSGETVNIRDIQDTSPTEPAFQAYPFNGDEIPVNRTSGDETLYWRPQSAARARRYQPMVGAGTEPRGLIGVGGRGRIYISIDIAATPNITAASLSIGDREYERVIVTSIDVTQGWIEIFLPGRGRTTNPWIEYSAVDSLTIIVGRVIGETDIEATLVGAYTLMLNLQDDVPSQVNLGCLPMFQSGDWTASEWLAAYNDATQYSKDRYHWAIEPIKLGELVSPDLQLAGLYLALDSNGRMIVRRLRLASPTELVIKTINKTVLLTDDGFPQYTLGAIGAYNQVDIQDGYNPAKDEYTSVPVRVRDVSAFGRNPKLRSLQISPKSTPRYDIEIPYEDAVRIAQGVLGIYGQPYAYVTCDVPLQFINVVLGETVSLNTKQLPSRDGTRGVDNTLGIVVAREIDLYSGRITLTILTSAVRTSGYAWGGRIEVGSENNISGDQWEFNLEPGLYYASGAEAKDYVNKFDAIVIYRWDSTSSTTITGTVEGASGNTVIVNLDSTWTPGSDEWAIAFEDNGGANTLTANQKRFAYIASSDSRVFGSDPARVFSPG